MLNFLYRSSFGDRKASALSENSGTRGAGAYLAEEMAACDTEGAPRSEITIFASFLSSCPLFPSLPTANRPSQCTALSVRIEAICSLPPKKATKGGRRKNYEQNHALQPKRAYGCS